MAKIAHGCDTFVALPSVTANGFVIFGKNSDRPKGEVQEVGYVAPQDHAAGTKVQCTYVEIEQVAHTNAVILSKPAWMWGAEMGANEYGVVTGNEAVWTKLNDETEDSKERLLGMDLLRLGLERAKSAKECLEVITQLLEKHGQGGPCSEDSPSLTYHNSFLIADRTGEAWVLETAGQHWVAEKVDSGFRHISNNLTIRTKIDSMSVGVKDWAKAQGWWNGADPFDFALVYSQSGNACGEGRQKSGDDLMTRYCGSKQFGPAEMMTVLRDKQSGICRGLDEAFVSTGSQVSVLTPQGKKAQCLHLFTGTPDPSISGFKPFVFAGAGVNTSKFIGSPKLPSNEDPAKVVPRFQKKVDRRHGLYKLHEAAFANGKSTADQIVSTLRAVEEQSIQDLMTALIADQPITDSETLFKDAVEAETRIYKNIV